MKSKMQKKTFSWKNSEFEAVNAADAAEVLDKIKEARGQLKPSDVVEEARDEGHPLHRAFPCRKDGSWDDTEAARIGRESIAARLIRSIRVEIVTPKREVINTRAFVSMPHEKAKGGRSYANVESAMDTPEGRAVLVRQAWLQLRAWRKRYGEIAELAKAMDAIDKILDQAS